MKKNERFDPNTIKRLLAYMKPYKGTLILVAVCIVLSALASAASSMFLQTLIDNYIIPMLGMDEPVFTGLIHALITIGAVYAVGTLATWIYNRRMVTVAQGTLKSIRDEMFTKMQRLPIRYFDTHTHGDTMSLYTNDTDTLRQMIAQSMAQLVSSACTLVAVFCCMLYLSIWLTVVVCVTMLIILCIAKLVLGRSGGYFASQQTALADLDAYIEEMVNGQKVIKVFCHEEEAKSELRRRNQVWKTNSGKANGYANSMMPMMNALGYVQYVLIALIGGYMAIAGTPNLRLFGFNTLTLGAIASFLTLSRNFINPISQIANQFNSIITALAGAQRIFDFMDEKPEIDDGYVTLVNVCEKDGELVECSEYTEKKCCTILRFMQNRDRKSDLRRSMGIVLQDVHLFTGTVMENLRYGNPNATDEQCISAAKLANADSFIRMLPQGYDTVLKGDGSGLSQGQRQLISIARAAVADPPVMILDEATSSIDTRTEMLVQAGMDRLMQGRTVFVIAHRLSTVRNSDVIMVLDHGSIIERGNHERLIEKQGVYYKLYTGALEQE